MIKAVIFDCFGVLVREGWFHFCEQYFGHDPSLMKRVIEANHQVNAGLSSYDDFLREVAELAGITTDHARSVIEANPANDELFRQIRDSLKPNYKIGLLSNAGANRLGELFTKDQLQLFDETVLSYQIGAIKPDPITYETIAQRLGVPADECLFIDDQLHYCQGAEAVGMKAIQYQSNTQLLNSFRKYNVLVENS